MKRDGGRGLTVETSSGGRDDKGAVATSGTKKEDLRPVTGEDGSRAGGGTESGKSLWPFFLRGNSIGSLLCRCQVISSNVL